MGVRLFIPVSHLDQHLTNRLAIIFDRVQKTGFLDSEITQNFRLILDPIYKTIFKYPRTCSIQKMMKSIFSISDRLESEVLIPSTEHVTVLEGIMEYCFNNTKDLKDEILIDSIRTLLVCPTYLLRNDPKYLEYIKRAVIMALEVS